jgi:hypothetical protein
LSIEGEEANEQRNKRRCTKISQLHFLTVVLHDARAPSERKYPVAIILSSFCIPVVRNLPANIDTGLSSSSTGQPHAPPMTDLRSSLGGTYLGSVPYVHQQKKIQRNQRRKNQTTAKQRSTQEHAHPYTGRLRRKASRKAKGKDREGAHIVTVLYFTWCRTRTTTPTAEAAGTD